MRTTGRAFLMLTAVTAVLAGCADQGNLRPRAKPDELVVNFLQPKSDKPGMGELRRARVSTKSGDIQILEADGSTTEMALDGPTRDPFMAISEKDLMLLNANLNLDLTGMADMGPVEKQTAQERAIEQFAARTMPMFPTLKKNFKAEPEMFKGASVVDLGKNKKPKAGDVVRVDANLKRGVDADTAFAYATCALASWAKANGTKYARHVMTDQKKADGELKLGSYFTLSDKQPLGLKVMKSDETLQECKDRGIPAT